MPRGKVTNLILELQNNFFLVYQKLLNPSHQLLLHRFVQKISLYLRKHDVLTNN